MTYSVLNNSKANAFVSGELRELRANNGVRSVGGGRAKARNPFVVATPWNRVRRTASIAATAPFGRFPVS